MEPKSFNPRFPEDFFESPLQRIEIHFSPCRMSEDQVFGYGSHFRANLLSFLEDLKGSLGQWDSSSLPGLSAKELTTRFKRSTSFRCRKRISPLLHPVSGAKTMISFSHLSLDGVLFPWRPL
jgi:hypothetical protein